MDLQAREVKRSKKKLALVIVIRFWTNFFVLMTLIGAGAAIYFSAAYELQIVSCKEIEIYLTLLLFLSCKLELKYH